MKKILLIIFIFLISQLDVLATDLFSDGFESGDLTAWSSNENDSGDLSAHADAKLHGNYGLKCLIDDTNWIFVQDNTPNAETRYRLRFYFDPNGLSMSDWGTLALFKGRTAGDVTCFDITLQYRTGIGYRIFAEDRTDAGNYSKVTSSYTITDEPHCIEVDWKASSAPGANDGTLELLIDGVSKQTLTGIDSDTESIGYIVLGMYGLDGTISGTYYLDDFASNDDGSEIGLISEEGNAIFFGINS